MNDLTKLDNKELVSTLMTSCMTAWSPQEVGLCADEIMRRLTPRSAGDVVGLMIEVRERGYQDPALWAKLDQLIGALIELQSSEADAWGLVGELVKAVDYEHSLPVNEYKYCSVCSALMTLLGEGGRICQWKGCVTVRARGALEGRS